MKAREVRRKNKEVNQRTKMQIKNLNMGVRKILPCNKKENLSAA